MNSGEQLKLYLELEEKLQRSIGELRRAIQTPAESIKTDIERSKQLKNLLKSLDTVQKNLREDSFPLNDLERTRK